MPRAAGQVVALGLAQTVAWASSTYLPAVLGVPMAESFGLPATRIFAAYSLALLVMAALGPAVGRAIDRRGGRGVLCLSNLVLAAGLATLGLAPRAEVLVLGWLVMGAGMALGLYDAAFAALVRQHGLGARNAITGITLLGGFASTLGWPLTAWAAATWDWRSACFLWGVLHLAVALPLNWWCLAAPPAREKEAAPAVAAGEERTGEPGRRDFLFLALFGAATAFVTSAMAAHLPGLFMAAGASLGAAVAASALVGPAQVAARLGEFLAARRFRLHPLAVARTATALHPLGALALLAGGGPGAAALALLHGAGNGLITIAKGTLPLALFGPRGYGARQGLLAVAQRIMQAAAPFVLALVLEAWGVGAALGLTMVLSVLALLALAGISRRGEGRAGR